MNNPLSPEEAAKLYGNRFLTEDAPAGDFPASGMSALDAMRLVAEELALGHGDRLIRRLGDEGVERARGFDRADMRFGQFDAGELALGEAAQGVGHCQLGEISHHSTTFGTRKK